jgi:hypothetical protein
MVDNKQSTDAIHSKENNVTYNEATSKPLYRFIKQLPKKCIYYIVY